MLATVWATAHTTQFSRPGWHFLPVGGGSGLLREGGTFVTYVERGDRANFSIVVEKFSGDGGQVSAETVGFCLAGSLRWAVGTPLSVWSSSFHSGGPASYLERAAPISPDARGCFNLSVPVNSLWTVTTLASGGRGSHPPPAACADFPLPYASSFESCLPPAEADYFSDVSGSWECVADGGSHGVVMRLQTPARPVSWEPAADGSPLGVFGQRDWADVSVTLDVRLNGANESFMLAVRANLRNATDHAALELEYVWPGLWLAWDTAGHWRLTDQANHGGGPRVRLAARRAQRRQLAHIRAVRLRRRAVCQHGRRELSPLTERVSAVRVWLAGLRLHGLGTAAGLRRHPGRAHLLLCTGKR